MTLSINQILSNQRTLEAYSGTYCGPPSVPKIP